MMKSIDVSNMGSWSPRFAVLISVLLAGMVIAISYSVYVLPHIAEVALLKKQLADHKHRYVRAYGQLYDRDSIIAVTDKVVAAHASLESRIVNVRSTALIMSVLSRQAGHYNLSLRRIQPQANIHDEGYVITPLSLLLEGSYADVISYIQALYMHEIFFDMSRVDMNANSGGNSNTVSVLIDLRVYSPKALNVVAP